MKISVTQLNNYINGVISCDGILSELEVEGETSNVKYSRDYLYWTLKDDDSAIDCFSYGDKVPELANGQKVVAFGSVGYLTKSGKISFFVKRVELSDKKGNAFLKLAVLKEKLTKEGLFDDSVKRKVSRSCLKIGVVTSAVGAVIYDICGVVARRNPTTNIFLYSVKVQGEGADASIAEGLNYFSANGGVDVVLVARGGGSNDDLSAFNSEIVVRAVRSCKVPVVSAVGHGINVSLCDLAADMSAVTPSEAAELVSADVVQSKQNAVAKLDYMSQLINGKLDDKQRKTEYALQILEAYNPQKVLAKGYAVVEKNGESVVNAKTLQVGDCVKIIFTDGAVTADVTKKEQL